MRDADGMRVTVVVFGPYASRLPAGSQGGRIEMKVEEGTSVRELADVLDLPEEVTRYVRRDAVRLGLDDVLSDGDIVSFVLPLAGG